jgi:hypothetical protein
MHFEIVGQITDIEIIAVGSSIRVLLEETERNRYGSSGRWDDAVSRGALV